MSSKQDPFDWIKKWLKPGEDKDASKGKLTKKHYFLIVLLLGVAFMLLTDLWSPKEQAVDVFVPKSESQESVETFGATTEQHSKIIEKYEEQYATQLKKALEEMVGVGEVFVVVNVDATELKVYEKDSSSQHQTTTETDQDGGKREIEDQSKDEKIVIIRKGDKETPVILETKKPPITGVLIVAKGADNIQVKKWIVEAVTKVLGIGSHQVSVMPKK
ncbi:stage III sporulation protein AG [Bacillus sp. 2205SS5-2]|uniref:stage III sporulation protein AG n=1 Tax=Bacillus sp. 2205SS5-2 TaxID=3109031 RepID=UPI003006A266